MSRDVNIFRIIDRMHDAWDYVTVRGAMAITEEEIQAWHDECRRFTFDGKDVRQVLLHEFSSFVFSCEWTKSQVVKDIVGYVERSVPLNEIGDLVGLKNSAFRMRVIRLTETINSLIFDGHPCPEGVYKLTDIAAIKRCLMNIRLLREPVVMNEEFSLRQLGWLDAQADGKCAERVTNEDLDKYFQSVLFLALTSRSFNLCMLDSLDPEILGYALRDMNAEGTNSTKLLFRLLLNRLSIESVPCKDELTAAKREYQEYARR